MPNKEWHASPQELLLLADGELPSRPASRVRAHLAACWDCRTRMAEIERTIADFICIPHQAFESELPPIARPRALLKARLAELAAEHPGSRWRRLRLQSSAFAFTFAWILVVLLGARTVLNSIDGSSDIRTYAEALPNPTLTPSLTRNVALSDLCANDHDAVARNVPVRLRQRVFREYGIVGAPDADYEVDYLITPGLGGAEDIRNLWPEPHHAPWNSYVQDQLEDRLHQMVCSGKISLTRAQQEIAHDWISAYKKYFYTDRPLRNYLTLNPPSALRRLGLLLALGIALITLRAQDRVVLRSFLSRSVGFRFTAFRCHQASRRSPGFQV
jgi:Putative zinc-finger